MSKRNKIYLIYIIVFLITIFSILAPYLAPNNPLTTDFSNILIDANEIYPLGTDNIGRCIYSRLLYGTQTTIGIALILIFAISIIGISIGSISGFIGGRFDRIVIRLGDILLAFPEVIFAIAIVGMLGAGIENTIIALSLIWWVKYARLSRILVKKEKNNEYIYAAKMVGASNLRIYFKYILPNIMPYLIVQVFLNIGTIIITLAGFSFLGLGVQPPTPEWGNMLTEGKNYIQTSPHLLIYPGLCIFFVVLLFNSMGEILRNILNNK